MVENFVDFPRFVVRQCCGCSGWWFVGCCGSVVVVSFGLVVGSVGWFGGGGDG